MNIQKLQTSNGASDIADTPKVKVASLFLDSHGLQCSAKSAIKALQSICKTTDLNIYPTHGYTSGPPKQNALITGVADQ